MIASTSKQSALPLALLCGRAGDYHAAARLALTEEGFEVATCAGAEAAVEELMRRVPDVLVFGLGSDGAREDLGQLRILRRVCPGVTLVIVGERASVESRMLLQELRPTYFALHPMDRGEWHEVVRTAKSRRPLR